MPLTALALSAALKAQMDAGFPLASHPDAAAIRQSACDKLAAAIVTEIVADNVVTVQTPAGTGVGKFV